MCAITGFLTLNHVSDNLIKIMNDTMKHRGPDSQQTENFEFDGKYASIGHCRLSILDLSADGNQPMWSNDHHQVIVFNGEIYNYSVIKEKLQEAGYCFHTKTDTEVILAAYKRWGEDCVSHFNGMFAFAIFDFEKKIVFIARDRFGKKPLYYYFENNTLVFASELKPFFVCPMIKKHIQKDVLAYYMRLGYIPAPYSILEDVYKLPAGCYMVISGRQKRVETYWNVVDVAKEKNKKNDISFNTAKEELKGMIWASVEKRLVADVPVGVFLSSGIDSSLVATAAQEISGGQINTYTIGVQDPKYNEAEIAKRIAKHLGTNHHEYYMSEQDLLDTVLDVPEYFDEPFSDTSLIPNMVLSKIVRSDITVALGGDGGDELFAGYPHYKFVAQAQKYDSIGRILKNTLPQNALTKLPHSMQRVINNRNPKTQSQIITESELRYFQSVLKNLSQLPAYFYEDKMGISNWQFRRMILDIKTTLTDDMLLKVDRAAMSASLEVRSPLLDYEIAEYSFQLPQKYKYTRRVSKYILKSILYDYIPMDLLNTPKRGFCVPVESWMRSELNELLLDMLNRDFIESQELFNYDVILKEYQKYIEGDVRASKLIWNYLLFQLWYTKYMKGVSMQ